jgi:replicative DNA helicase
MSSSDVSLERTMPNSVESERAVLGAILLDEKAIFAAAEFLTPDDFYLEAHREIFRAMLSLAEEEISIDCFTLREELRRRNEEKLAGGTAYIAGLTMVSHAPSIRRTTQEKSGRKQPRVN